MSRYNNNGNGNNAVVTNMLHAIKSKEGLYKEEIKRNHQLAKTLAKRLVPEDDLEKTLRSMSSVVSSEEVDQFCQEQRARLQALAKENVQDERTVNCFLASIEMMRQNPPQAAEGEELIDYQAKIQELMEQDRNNRRDLLLDMEQETYYREICEELGVPLTAAAAADDDDGIEVVRGNNQGAGNALKCPLTACLLEDPVKNKYCGHVYSKAAIVQYLRQRNHACPVAGCHNNSMSQSQLEADTATALLVKRQRRREEAHQQQLASQADLVDSDDDV